MNYWKILPFVGTFIFFLSGSLPMVADAYGSSSLINLYAAIWQATGFFSPIVGPATIGVLLTLTLYPVSVILGFVAILNRKIGIVSGILGLVCWIGTLEYLAQFNATSYAGAGVYVGIFAAAAMVLAFLLEPTQPLPQSEGESVVAPA